MKQWKRFCSMVMVLVLAVGFLPAYGGALGEDPWDREFLEIQQIEFPSHTYTLGKDETFFIRVRLFEDIGEEEMLFVRIKPMEHPWMEGHMSFFYPMGDNTYEAVLNFTEERDFFEPGDYEVTFGIFPIYAMDVQIYAEDRYHLEIIEAEPITEVPEVTYVSMSPASISAGKGGTVEFHATLEFEDNYAFANLWVMIKLWRLDDSAPGARVEVTSELVNLNHATYLTDEINFFVRFNNSNGLNNDGLEAGTYVIEFEPNYKTEFEGVYGTVLHTFEVAEPKLAPVRMFVHTDEGLAEVGTIGNQDVVTLEFEEWGAGYPGTLYIKPVDLVIGSPRWRSSIYSMYSYDESGMSFSDSHLTYPGVVMSARDIPAGDYVFFYANNDVISTPFTIFEGSSTIASELQSIDITTAPYQTTYMVGDRLDLSGLVVTARYDVTRGRVVSGYTTSIAPGAVLGPEDTTVTVSYTEGFITRTADFAITVLAPGERTVINVNDRANGITIRAGSGDYLIQGAGKFVADYMELYEDYIIRVESGYEGIIRLQDLDIDTSLYDRMIPILVESGAAVIFELEGDSTLLGTSAAFVVTEGAEIAITSSTQGTLEAFGGSNGAAIGGGTSLGGRGSVAAGTIKIYGNAVVHAEANSGAAIGGAGRRTCDSTVIISGNAVVTAHSNYGGAIGGGAESSAGGVGSPGGVVMIKGNAKVTATSTYGTGIGGGNGGHTGGDGGTITIGENAVVDAFSEHGTAIGGGNGGSNGHGGLGGDVTIEENALVTAVSTSYFGSGIGGGANTYMSGFGASCMGINLHITGGTVNAANSDRGYAIGGNVASNYVVMEGGSVYPAGRSVYGAQNSAGDGLIMVTLTVVDGIGNELDGVRLTIGGQFEAVTGNNLVWDEDANRFSSDVQHGVAYVWLRSGAQYTVLADGTAGTPETISVTTDNNVFTLVLEQEEIPGPFQGEGTQERPYLIGTDQELAELSALLADRATYFDYYDSAYRLTGSLDLSTYENWTPIGIVTQEVTGFAGHFDGGGYEIKGLTIHASTGEYTGLFGLVAGGTVENLRLTDVDVTGYLRVGGLAGGVEFGGLVKNCSVSGQVTGDSYVGGLVGEIGSLGNVNNIDLLDTVECCLSTAVVSGRTTVGGIAGSTSRILQNCAALGERVTATSAYENAGRITGEGSGDWVTGNIAFAGMLVNGDSIDGSIHKDGMGKTAAQLQSRDAFPQGSRMAHGPMKKENCLALVAARQRCLRTCSTGKIRSSL